MITRLVAAMVGLAVLLPALFLGGVVAVEVIAALAAAVCWWEFVGMAMPEDRAVGLAWGGAALAAAYGAVLYGSSASAVPTAAVITVATMAFVTLRPGADLGRAADRVGQYLLGVAYVSLLTSLPMLRRLDDGLAWVFVVLAVSWLGDTGGYFAGKYFGRTKLYPLVSPKKTWEGVAGGIALATAGLFVVRSVALPALSVVDVLVLGPSLCAAGVVGDLSESLMKRAWGVKDSGTIMPGHGGLLDRIDSVLFVAPLLYAYLALTKGVA